MHGVRLDSELPVSHLSAACSLPELRRKLGFCNRAGVASAASNTLRCGGSLETSWMLMEDLRWHQLKGQDSEMGENMALAFTKGLRVPDTNRISSLCSQLGSR